MMVDLDNVAVHQIGTVLNVRRGEGATRDFLLGDLLVTRRDGITAIRGGKRALSVGYEAAALIQAVRQDLAEIADALDALGGTAA